MSGIAILDSVRGSIHRTSLEPPAYYVTAPPRHGTDGLRSLLFGL